MTREEVVEIIQKSGDTLHICVQPIPELIELSVRPASDGGKIEIQDDVVKGGTLKRNASLRYKKGVSNIVLLLIFIKLYLYYSGHALILRRLPKLLVIWLTHIRSLSILT
jgi:hypothetical protein